jgi:hypothetical protein
VTPRIVIETISAPVAKPVVLVFINAGSPVSCAYGGRTVCWLHKFVMAINGLGRHPECWTDEVLGANIHAAAALGSREYPRSNPPSLERHLIAPVAFTPRNRPFGGWSWSPRCGRIPSSRGRHRLEPFEESLTGSP